MYKTSAWMATPEKVKEREAGKTRIEKEGKKSLRKPEQTLFAHRVTKMHSPFIRSSNRP